MVEMMSVEYAPSKTMLRAGEAFERIVARIQQMMDPTSTVLHNGYLIDRVGNRRQYDVIIRGEFAGRSVLGILECKDHKRKKGPDTVEAFAKKTENLGANLRVIVSKSGFTPQALKLAKHENIGCVSLLPDENAQVGFNIGNIWYGVIRDWKTMRLRLRFSQSVSLASFDPTSVKWQGKPVMNWFKKELFTTYANIETEGLFTITVDFDDPKEIEIGDQILEVCGISCMAEER